MNKVILIGRLGQDIEIKTAGSTIFGKTSLATTRFMKKEKVTDWHRLTLFNKQAENAAKYLKKGSQCGIEGQIQYGSYEKDGTTIYTTDIIVNNIEYLDSKKDASIQNQESEPAPVDEDDEIPF